MSHTPGPWKVYDLDWRVVVDPWDDVVADVRGHEHDARLITAAPDLLAIAEEILLRGSSGYDTQVRLVAAITKAKG